MTVNPEVEAEKQLNKAIKISRMPTTVRSTEEIEIFVNQLAKFSFFDQKVPDNHLGEVLRIATVHIKHQKVKAGRFFSHVGQNPDCIYLIAKGEAWRFREKTEEELKLEGIHKKKKMDLAGTILLAAASKTRDHMIQIKDQARINAALANLENKSKSRRSSKISKGSMSLKSARGTNAVNSRRNSRIPLLDDSDDSLNSSFASNDDSESSTPGNMSPVSGGTNNILGLPLPRKNSLFKSDFVSPFSHFSPAEKSKPRFGVNIDSPRLPPSNDSPRFPPIITETPKLQFNDSDKSEKFVEKRDSLRVNILSGLNDEDSPKSVDTSTLTIDYKPKNSNNQSLSSRLRDTVKLKITTNMGIINYENDYMQPILQQDPDLVTRYMHDGNSILKFERRYIKYQAIGEISLSVADTRDYALFAYTDLQLWSLDLKAYEQIFATQIEEVQDKMKFFVDNFTKMNQAALRRACFLFEEVCYPVGEIVFKEGSQSEGLYFIKSGEVHLLKKIEARREKDKDKILEDESPEYRTRKLGKVVNNTALVCSVIEGQFFGEEVIEQGLPRKFTAKSCSYLICYKISNEILSKLPDEMKDALKQMSLPRVQWREKKVEELNDRQASLPKEEVDLKDYAKYLILPKKPENIAIHQPNPFNSNIPIPSSLQNLVSPQNILHNSSSNLTLQLSPQNHALPQGIGKPNRTHQHFHKHSINFKSSKNNATHPANEVNEDYNFREIRSKADKLDPAIVERKQPDVLITKGARKGTSNISLRRYRNRLEDINRIEESSSYGIKVDNTLRINSERSDIWGSKKRKLITDFTKRSLDEKNQSNYKTEYRDTSHDSSWTKKVTPELKKMQAISPSPRNILTMNPYYSQAKNSSTINQTAIPSPVPNQSKMLSPLISNPIPNMVPSPTLSNSKMMPYVLGSINSPNNSKGKPPSLSTIEEFKKPREKIKLDPHQMPIHKTEFPQVSGIKSPMNVDGTFRTYKSSKISMSTTSDSFGTLPMLKIDTKSPTSNDLDLGSKSTRNEMKRIPEAHEMKENRARLKVKPNFIKISNS